MKILGIDVGSSSIKAGIVRAGKIVGKPVRVDYPTRFDGPRAEVDPAKLLKALAQAIADLGPAARKVDAVGLSVMSPAWIAMDRAGKPLTPLVTHQDRRSVDVAIDLERRLGRRRLLGIIGNRPFPGGISLTTLAWYHAHAPGLIRRADLIGHLNTFLHRQITARRVIDPSNASFTGLYETVKQGGWSADICRAVGVRLAQLPDIFQANEIPGPATTAAASKFGLQQGVPVMAGIIDTSAAMLLAGARPGQLLNVSGSTDVLGLCTDQAHPRENLLTRALGLDRLWMSVSTLAAGASTLTWTRDLFFPSVSPADFYRLVARLARQSKQVHPGPVNFQPYLAGERTSIEQKHATLGGLSLATTPQDILLAVIDALAVASGERLNLLRSTGVKMLSRVVTSGGAARVLHNLLHRDWRGRWTFHHEEEASLRGLSMLQPRPS